MALEEGNSGIPATMLVGPASVGNAAPYPIYMGQGGNGSSGGWDNGNGWWIILLFILLASGNWGNNGNGNGGGMFGGTPIIVNDGNGGAVQRGFDQAAVMSGITGVQSGVQNLSTQLCDCCGDVQMALCNGFAGVEQGANTRQMANMQTAFGLQTAMSQGFNSLGSQFADCCCENRLGLANLANVVQTENCADRYEAAQNTRDIIDSQSRGTQAILDKLCSLELDNYRRENDQLRTQLNMANLAASQTAQTSQITDQIYNRLSTCPVGTVPVYGEQPIFTCNNNNCGCGCGCGNGF